MKILSIISFAFLIFLLLPVIQVLGATPQYSKTTFFYLYNSWITDYADSEDEASEGVFGVSARHLVNENIVFELLSTLSNASFQDDDEFDASFSALNDTRLQATYFLRNGKASVKLTTNLPTGKKKLSAEQYQISARIADKSRYFSVRRLGQGFDVGAAAFFHPGSDKTRFSLGGGYLAKGSYQVLNNNSAKYKYGNEAYLNFKIESQGTPVRLSGEVTYKFFGKDEFGSQPVFQSGNLLAVRGKLIHSGQITGSLGISFYSRGKAKVLSSAGNELTEESERSGRNEIHLNATSLIPITKPVRLLFRAQFSNISANEYDSDAIAYKPQSTYFGLGGGLLTSLTEMISTSLNLTYFSGTIDDEFDLSGIGVTGTLTIRYW